MIVKREQYQDLINRLYPETQYQKNQTANITFQVTDDCNLCCTYCYQINKGHHIMPFEIAKNFIDIILSPNSNTQQYLNSLDSTAVILDFIGGEPFLQIDLIDKIITYFITRCIELNHPWQYHYIISICSNGTLYFNDKVQQFLQKYKNCLSFTISIDGNKKLHDKCRIFADGTGSYDLAIKAKNHYIQYYNNFMDTKMTLSPDNIKYTKDAVINLINEKYDNIFLNCIFEKGWTYEHATILYYQLKELSDYILNNDLEDKVYISMFDENLFHPKEITDKQNWCGGNGAMIALDYKGDIYPCLRYMESSLGSSVAPLIIGNTKIGIMETKEQQETAKLVQSVNRLTQSSKECLECPIAEGCSWCQAYNYQDSGNINHRATYICCMHKARALANSYYWNNLYKKQKINKRFKIYLSNIESLKIINEKELNLLYKLKNED